MKAPVPEQPVQLPAQSPKYGGRASSSQGASSWYPTEPKNIYLQPPAVQFPFPPPMPRPQEPRDNKQVLTPTKEPRDNKPVLTPPRRPMAKARPIEAKARPIATPMSSLSAEMEQPIMRAALTVMAEAIEQIRARL